MEQTDIGQLHFRTDIKHFDQFFVTRVHIAFDNDQRIRIRCLQLRQPFDQLRTRQIAVVRTGAETVIEALQECVTERGSIFMPSL